MNSTEQLWIDPIDILDIQQELYVRGVPGKIEHTGGGVFTIFIVVKDSSRMIAVSDIGYSLMENYEDEGIDSFFPESATAAEMAEIVLTKMDWLASRSTQN
jgi:hypothetical protein